MPRAKRNAGDNDPHGRSPEPGVEAVQQERALDFFADAAGHDHDEREQPGVSRPRQEMSQRIVLNGVQKGRGVPSREQCDRADSQRGNDQRDAVRDFAGERPGAQEDVSGGLAMRAQKQQDEPDKDDGIQER